MKYIFSFLIIFSISCIKESQTTYTAKIKNETSTIIKFKVHSNSKFTDSITLKQGEIIEIAHGSDMGIVNHAGFDSYLISNSDSFTVIYNKDYWNTHHTNYKDSSDNNPRIIARNSNRNIYNYENYIYSFNDKKKHFREATYIFTFTEKDYLDAKK